MAHSDAHSVTVLRLTEDSRAWAGYPTGISCTGRETFTLFLPMVIDNGKMEAMCCELAALLNELARQRCRGNLSDEQFVEAILKIEEEQMAPMGFTLSASNTIDDWTVVKVRISGSRHACAAFEFLPETGEFRRVGTTSETAAPTA